MRALCCSPASPAPQRQGMGEKVNSCRPLLSATSVLGLEKLGFPGGTPSVAVDISGVNNSFQVEVGMDSIWPSPSAA